MKTKLAVLTLLLLAACGDGGKKKRNGNGDASIGADAGQNDGGSGDDDPVVTAVGVVKGRVAYADGSSAGQVEVSIGNKSYETDNRGVFVATDVPKGKQQVKVSGQAVTAAQVEVSISPDKSTQVDLAVLPMETVPVEDASKAGSVSTKDGSVVVSLGDKALQKKGGGEAVGTAEARIGVVKSSGDVKAAPGGMRAEVSDEPVTLESFAMVDLRFVQDDEELELAKPIEIELPLGPHSFADGDEVDMFSFDVVAGMWKLEGKAVIDAVANKAKLRVPHLSWWCVGAPIPEPTCMSGRLINEAGEPVSDIVVTARGESYWGLSSALSDADGNFCVEVKPGSDNNISAFGISGATYFEWSQDATAGASSAACGEGTCTDLGTLTGTGLFDECQGNVTSGQDHVLVLSSGNEELDMALATLFEEHGQTATIGSHFDEFDGTLDLSPYDAIYLQANADWGGDMPVAGQRQLINWVNCGGGLVTTEWTTWKIGTGGFQLIDAVFPAARTSNYNTLASETFVQVTPDPTINAGLPESFTFMTTNYSGTESYLNPRPGAVIYYDSEMLDAGLIGWAYNMGRVASFSTTVGTSEVADENFSRLIVNVVNWVQRE